MLLQRDVLLLSVAYFCMNYVFYMFAQWLFVYLVEERGFSLLESGVLYALPFATGAALAAAGGLTCDVLCRRIGSKWGCRLPAMRGLVLVAMFLVAGAHAVNPYAAVIMLSLCFGFTQFTEGAFWSRPLHRRPIHAAARRAQHRRQAAGSSPAGRLMWISSAGWPLVSGSVFGKLRNAVRVRSVAPRGPA